MLYYLLFVVLCVGVDGCVLCIWGGGGVVGVWVWGGGGGGGWGGGGVGGVCVCVGGCVSVWVGGCVSEGRDSLFSKVFPFTFPEAPRHCGSFSTELRFQ